MVAAGEFSPYLQTQKRPSSAASQALSTSSYGHGPMVQRSGGSATSSDLHGKASSRQAAALELWNKWAVDALGPMSSKPSPDELNKKSSHLKRIIRESEKLTASVNSRISNMADVRAELNNMSESSLSIGAASPSKNAKDAIRKSRQSARRSMNDFLKHEGKIEASMRPATANMQSTSSNHSLISSMPGSPSSRRSPTRTPRSTTKALAIVDTASTIPAWERDSMSASIRAAERETAEQMGEKEELLSTVDLLRAKLHAQDVREIENQRRLQQYDKLAPIFDRLGEKFHFKSAEEVIDRLEFLENDKLSTYDQLLEAQSDIRRLEKQLKEHRKEKEAHQQAMENEHHAKVSKVQKQLSEARSEVENLGMELRSNTQRLEVAQRLSNAVINLWNKMHDNSEVMKQKPQGSDDIPVREPLHMVQCIYELMTMHSTVATGLVMRDINLVCNRVWSHFFRGQISIKGDTLMTVKSMEEWMHTQEHKLVRADHNVHKLQSKEKEQRIDNNRLQRQVNALQSDIGKRDDLTRQSIRVVNAQPPRPGQTCPNCKQVVGRPVDAAALPAAASSAALPPVPEGDVAGIAENESSVFITECGGGAATEMSDADKPQWSSSINLQSKQRRPASAVVRPTSGVSAVRNDTETQRPTSAIVTATPRADDAGAVATTRPTSGKAPSQRPMSAKPAGPRPGSGMSQRTTSATPSSARVSAPSNGSRASSAGGTRNAPDSSSRSAVGPMGAHWDAMLRAGHTGSVDFSADSAAAVSKVKPTPASRSWGRENKARRGGLNDAVAQHARQ